MKKSLIVPMCIILTALACKKHKTPAEDQEVIKGDIKQIVETVNGITYKIFTDKNATDFKGILVVGSGNDENNPSEGQINGTSETALCEKAAANGYAAAIVRYQKPPNGADWNSRAKLMGEDFNKAIVGISGKYSIDKNKSVVGGFSYASFMLFSDISVNTTLSYTKGVLGACGGSGAWNAQNFKVPVFAINCSGNNEGNFNGKALYDQIPVSSAVKAKSEGVTDNNCNSHCGGDWTKQMYNKMVFWLQ
ncbi:hypothetical protein OQZ33_23675 [Pedobacter sp. MC2016-05]|uniref:hypothetical protein n=1 Tax=Pedobacter sp. MC2016-05 TaxID=2994474 RepID=UPI002245121F|nr:hypothetical protein [Pedobacter sp. MC2016-05]MCX2477355.1 hypothetical protein [Pedobacter sp. MC2016-05]